MTTTPMTTIAPDANNEPTLWTVNLDPTDGITLTAPPIAILRLADLPDHVTHALETGYRFRGAYIPAHEIEGL